MKKNKYPIFDDFEIEINKKKAIFHFDGGDLGERKNIDNNEEIATAVQKIHNFIVEHNLANNGKKFDSFGCLLSYTIPNHDQYNFYLKNKKYEADYPYESNYLHFDLLHYYKEKKMLWVPCSFLEDSETHSISLITEHLTSINKIKFSDTMLDCNLFAGYGDEDKDDFEYSTRPKYITNTLGHKKWHHPVLFIDEPVWDDGLFKNHLDLLVEARKFIDPKIKFEISGASEKEKKCFESAGLF